MDNQQINERFSELSTSLIADACLRLKITLRLAPHGLRPLTVGSHIAGRVLPAKHYGSVDVFLEAMGMAQPGDVLVIDNAGRADEGCVGDLTALEAQASGLAGVLIWGCHRDTIELNRIGLPIFSYGTCPAGPQRLDPRDQEALNTVHFGNFTANNEDIVFADADGALFVPAQPVEEILETASAIWIRERGQAQDIQAGTTLRQQLRFAEYLEQRSKNPSYTFRQHLRAIGGAIEE